MPRRAWTTMPVLALVAGCHAASSSPAPSDLRNWWVHPAVISLTAHGAIYAASDIHGGYDRFAALLARHGLITGIPTSPELARWAGGDAMLVITGDLFDKGPAGLEVIDLLRALQTSAALQGGAVIVTLGNHEAEFFADPTNSKAEGADGIDHELDASGIDLVAFARGEDPHGDWLRQQPFAARIDDWFFAHGGDTHGRTFEQLDEALHLGFDQNGFRDAELIGSQSILEARDWFGDPTEVASMVQAMGVAHIVFGHDPNALGPRGTIAMANNGALFRIDCGMSPDINDSSGVLLRIRADVAEELDADGSTTELWHP